MRQTLRELIASMMPSATAWPARSSLDQWVMCNPRAIGSRQASWMIWAFWRGGNPGRSPGSLLPAVGQQALQPGLRVTLAGSPDGGRVAFQTFSDALEALASGKGQDDASPADLIPRQGIAAA